MTDFAFWIDRNKERFLVRELYAGRIFKNDFTTRVNSYIGTTTVVPGNSLFVGEPIIPCAYLVHTQRYHSDHKTFLADIADNVTGHKT